MYYTIHLSVSPSVCLSICLSVCLSVCHHRDGTYYWGGEKFNLVQLQPSFKLLICMSLNYVHGYSKISATDDTSRVDCLISSLSAMGIVLFPDHWWCAKGYFYMVVIGLGMRLPRELKLTDGARSEASKKTSMMSFLIVNTALLHTHLHTSTHVHTRTRTHTHTHTHTHIHIRTQLAQNLSH